MMPNGSVDGFGQSGISKSLSNFGYPSIELGGKDIAIGKNKPMKKRRIYQLGTSMPCIENDDECTDDQTQSR